MHPYVLQKMSDDRIRTLHADADRRRLVAGTSASPRDALATRLQQRVTSLRAQVAMVAPVRSRPQPCMC